MPYSKKKHKAFIKSIVKSNTIQKKINYTQPEINFLIEYYELNQNLIQKKIHYNEKRKNGIKTKKKENYYSTSGISPTDRDKYKHRKWSGQNWIWFAKNYV
jgi:hypothetical protein